MKSRKQSTLIILAGLLLILSGVLVWVVTIHQQASIEYIHSTLPTLLKETIKENARRKTTNIPFSGLAHTPNKIGTIEQRTFTNSDTTFTYKCTIVDAETEVLRSQQTFLLLTENLYSNDIRLILDSLLNQKNINCQITTGINATFYKKINDWSPQNDTATTRFNYHTSLTKQGLLGDINYHAYINYSFKTLWKLMPQTLILSLLLLDILILCLLIGFIIKQKCRKQTESKAAVPQPTTNNLKFTGQLSDLFQMFTEGNGQVSKETIKMKFWPKNENPTTNMTTLVDRLKKKLVEAEYPCTIITDPEDDKFYKLTAVEKTI